VNATIAPALVIRGPGVMAALGGHVAALGARPLLVRGRVGFEAVRGALEASLATADLPVAAVRHDGPVTPEAIERLATPLRAGAHDVVVGVGGGRVLDAAKAAAHRCALPFVAVPTSPATCAAVTALSVLYDEDGRWSGPTFAARCPDVALLDADVLAAAPDRLLAAGVLDAVCKVEEVRLAARSAAADGFLDCALALCDVLAKQVDPATGALADGLPAEPAARAALAEAVVVAPGLIAGLAGEGNKLAAAHALHNALTQLPGHHRSLHGEVVAFGVLVQMALLRTPFETIRERARWMLRLGVDVSLDGLGCGAYHAAPAPVLAWALGAPALRHAFPSLTQERLAEVVDEVDRVAGERPSTVH
jgi:glycerol dehydrogenase